MESGLEDRNNMGDKKTIATVVDSVSMESGLEDRNNWRTGSGD